MPSEQPENSDDYPQNVGRNITRNVSSRISIPTASYSERLASSNICFKDERRFFGKHPHKSVRNSVCFSDCRRQDKTSSCSSRPTYQTTGDPTPSPAQLSLFAEGDTPAAACLFLCLTTYCADVAFRTVLCHTRHQFWPHNKSVCLTWPYWSPRLPHIRKVTGSNPTDSKTDPSAGDLPPFIQTDVGVALIVVPAHLKQLRH